MKNLRLSFIFLCAAFLCVANSNPLLNLFAKSDDKAEADEKETVSTASMTKFVGHATTTTTASPSASCGGLKGFLHICDKNEPTEPPKSVKIRSLPEKNSDEDNDGSKSDDDDDDDDDDDADDDDDDDSDEKSDGREKNEEKPKATETSSVSESTEGRITKRQVGDPEAPILGEVPPVIADAIEVPKEPTVNSADDKALEEREADDSDSNSDSDEDDAEENIRRRRDCRDREGDYYKDCRRKREYIPSCFGLSCRRNATSETNE